MSESRTAIPISKPSLGEAEAAAAREAILSGWVTQGPRVAAFEQAFAECVGAPNACAVSSCTAALHLALHALGVGPGDEVVTVSHSFVATTNAIRQCGARPVFVDIDPRTLNMDSALLEAAISSRTAAVLPVHQLGLPCPIGQIVEIAARHRLPVVEDAACALGSRIHSRDGWQEIGRPHGTIACFSFHPRKVITTGEGGMLTTRDPQLDRRFRLLRQHGMSVSDVARHTARQIQFADYPLAGFNYRMTDVQAAIGLVQLARLDQILGRHRQLAARYTSALRDIIGLTPPRIPADTQPNFQSYAVRVGAEFPLRRDELMQALLDRGIHARSGVMNAHQEAAHADLGPQRLPHSEAARDQTILLPLHASLTDDEQNYILDQLQTLATGASRPLAKDAA